ncbi:MAG: hypothetical protein SOX36_01165 [Candidatus Cryptobacteroides sp.]|nr:hypothetical protein [Candidatus Cryptobacteroides sp.]
MMDNSPVYTSFGIARIVEFNTIFPSCAMPNISKCLRGFNRDQMFGGFLANLVNKVVNRPFYNPDYRGEEKDIDTLRFFLSGDNVGLIKKSIDILNKTAQRDCLSVGNYIGATEESALYLAREIMATGNCKENRSKEKIEREYLKALLAANTITLQKGRSKNKRKNDDAEMNFAELFVRQFGSADFLYTNKRLLLLTQTVKCMRFFEFAMQDTALRPLVQDFCDYYGIKNWWIYPKALWSVYVMTGGKAGIVNVGRIAMKEAAQYSSVIEKLSIPSSSVIPKSENVDYSAFRARPLIKITDDEYVVFNFQLVIERIYSGLYFDFRQLAENRGIERSEFKRHFSTEFSEQSLFCGAMTEALNNHFDVIMTDEDCLNNDKSNDAKNTSKPDFYARKGNVVLLFENKDILLAQETKEYGSVEQLIDFLKTRLCRNAKGKPEGVSQLMNLVGKIRSGEFQKRWDADCPQDAVIYPVLVVPEAKFTLQGVKNLLQRWQLETSVSMDNVKPVALVDIGTVCLYQNDFAINGILSYLDDYYERSDFKLFEKSEDLNNIPNALMSFTDYLCHTSNDTLSKFREEWEAYLKKGE